MISELYKESRKRKKRKKASPYVLSIKGNELQVPCFEGPER